MKRTGELAVALLLELLGGAGALLVGNRDWQSVTTPRPAPFSDDVLAVHGRTLDAAPTALALVALAGVVAVLATRAQARRIIGAVVLVCGAALIWRSVAAAAAISTRRAGSLVVAHHPTVDVAGVTPHVTVHGGWAVSSVGCGVLVALAGALVAWRGDRWQVLSTRYERAPKEPSEQARATSLWADLDRGHDPTSDSTSDPTL